MPIETARREVDIRVVRCDWLTLDEAGNVTASCDKITSEFLPDVADAQGGPVLMDARWLQLRTGGIRQWYFCTHDHLAAWVTGPGAAALGAGAQSLGTLRARAET